MAHRDRSGKCFIYHYTVLNLLSLQPIAAFEHPAFQRMIHLASRATRGITILNKKQSRDKIILIFKARMNDLKQCLNVCICL